MKNINIKHLAQNMNRESKCLQTFPLILSKSPGAMKYHSLVTDEKTEKHALNHTVLKWQSQDLYLGLPNSRTQS